MKECWVIGPGFDLGVRGLGELGVRSTGSARWNRRMQAKAFLAMGRPALENILDRSVEPETCPVRWPGKRLEHRASWEGYVYTLTDGRLVVAAPEACKLTGKGRSRNMPYFRGACRTVAALVQGSSPLRPVVLQCPTQATKMRPPYGVDLETFGDGSIARLGLASEEGTLSCHWDHRAIDLCKRLLPGSELIIHNAPFDVPLLESALALTLDRSLVWDTMQAHTLLFTGRRALGHIAPLYLPIEPWKHRAESEQAAYNALDAAVLLPISSMQAQWLEETGQLSVWHTLERYTPWLTVKRKFGALTYHPIGELLGQARDVGHLVAGFDLGELSQVVSARVMGLGPIQAKGLLGVPVKAVRSEWETWLVAHPDWAAFIDRTAARAKKDGFVHNHFGRRLRTRDAKRALAFIMQTTADDLLLQGLVKSQC